MPTQVLQGRLVLPDRIVDPGQMVVEDGLIQAVVEEQPRFRPTADFEGSYIAPGYIDLHVHGIAGADVMDASGASLELMARRFAPHGVTGWLPTTVTESLELTKRVLAEIRDYMTAEALGEPPGARVLGIHLEGPWISKEFKGAQNERHILAPDVRTVEQLLEAGGEAVTLVSLAPELPGAGPIIRLLRDRGIYVSIAHTGATYEQALEAVKLGASQVTHCFNAMTGLHHRVPGVAGATLLCRDLWAELIPDGIHVHPAVMQLLLHTKGPDRVMLVTDAMSATELPGGSYRLGGQEVMVLNGDARLANGTIAGSTLTLDQGVRNIVRLCSVSLADAVCMASTVPAAAIGLGERLGKLQAGYTADLVVLDETLHPRATLVGGVQVPPPAEL